jgi:flavorubredoxin
MKNCQVIFEDGTHRWLAVSRDPARPNFLIDTNEYLVVDGDAAILCDPGGTEIFPSVFSAISAHMNPASISALFASHQDPDIISSLALWLEFNPSLKCHVSWLWGSFIPHFGGDGETFVAIPDAGATIPLGNLDLQAIPAHYLHSSGNHNLYDAKARVLFSGDIGAALLPPDEGGLYVTDFDRHIRRAELFHRRWMGSNEAKNDWCDRVGNMQIDMLCPQHGAIYRGEDVARFIQWFRDLKVGVLEV